MVIVNGRTKQPKAGAAAAGDGTPGLSPSRTLPMTGSAQRSVLPTWSLRILQVPTET